MLTYVYLCYLCYFVSMLFADLLSLQLVTFLMFFILVDMYVRAYLCASTLITCAIIISRTLLPCNLTRVDFSNLDGCFV